MPSATASGQKEIESKTQTTAESHNNNNGSERSAGSCSNNRARKRKRCGIVKFTESDLESEFEDCDLQDALAIEKKLRKVAKVNELSDEEMRKLLQKFVKNEHVLALVMLKAENELARERREAEQRAIIITDTPSVAKLTRAKARELNTTPGITLPSLKETPQPDIAALIKDDLHSDEDDEEYMFKEEDFISDEDPNTTISDMESNPRTPLTPLTQTENEDSPVKFSADGCFKVPLDKHKDNQEDLRIATRTRSKLCLQQTTIEDIQSEFVPPDVEPFDFQDTEMMATDDEWMQFLNDFSKPLNTNFLGDDDDPINDPEYVAAEKIPVDAEELRDVNISKKELTELVAELFEGLINEGASLESIDLETPHKFVSNTIITPGKQLNAAGKTPTHTAVAQITRQIDFDVQQQNCVSDATISSTNITQNEYSFHPDVMSTPSINAAPAYSVDPPALVPIAYTANTFTNSLNNTTISTPFSLNTHPELIAVPIPGQPNCYQLAKVIAKNDDLTKQTNAVQMNEKAQQVATNDTRYTTPYDNNFTWQYISIKKHVYSEYLHKFENLRNLPKDAPNTIVKDLAETQTGFTQAQHDMLQQQLRIHVQMLTQTFLQTYSHPEYWKLAPKAKEMLHELQAKSKVDASFNASNLNSAVELTSKWEEDLSKDTPENKEMMSFIYKEIELTNRNTRQIPRFTSRMMDVVLNSTVFMYPQYLPRIPFSSKVCSYHVFSPAETQLIALGLEKHMQRIQETGERISKKADPLVVACGRLSKDTVFGKTKRRIWDHIKALRKSKLYNPVKYFFEHNRAPPIEQELIAFDNNIVLPPKERFRELPLAWQTHIEKKNAPPPPPPPPKKLVVTPRVLASEQARNCYLEFVREAVGAEIQLPENFAEAAQPQESATDVSVTSITADEAGEPPRAKRLRKGGKERRHNSRGTPTSLTINVNYVFGATVTNAANAANKSLEGNVTLSVDANDSTTDSLNCSRTFSSLNCTTQQIATAPLLTSPNATITSTIAATPAPLQPVAFEYNCGTRSLDPVFEVPAGSEHSRANTSPSQAEDCENPSEIQVKKKNLIQSGRSPRFRHTRRRRRSRHFKKPHNYTTFVHIAQSHRNAAQKYRLRCHLQKRCNDLLSAYRLLLETNKLRYENAPIVQRYYHYFITLELYTDLLIDLKMLCRNATTTATANSNNTAANNSASNTGSANKRARISNVIPQTTEDEGGTAGSRSKKANRQEENFRHMLLPDSAEDANRKDAIYAFNFYEKVEEALKSSNRPEDCKKFSNILKTFDPKRDKVSDLYYKLEKLFLPEHPELAQVFLTFLLPSEAAEIGKFFEHFMITNAATFINKLNVYFNKQPAQIRKIYNCLNELAEDSEVTMKKVESKILPLLKGNQFLIDWFMQQFAEAAPPDRLLAAPEHINLKEVQNNQSGEFMETVTDLLDSPTAEQQQSCQLRYINGRIFYGSKMTLPAKLSFMATSYQASNADCADSDMKTNTGCIHGIREHGEKRLATAAAAAAASAAVTECSSDDNEKSEEDDVSKALIIDTTAGEEDSCSSIETCDDASLRTHAMRLNPNYYGTSCFAASTSTPNQGSNHQPHHPNSKKFVLNFNEEGKISPRKQHTSVFSGITPLPTNLTFCSSLNAATTATTNAITTVAVQLREKRKSPTKKNKSPINAARPRVVQQPMVVIHERNSAIACAKKLKSLIEEDNESETDSKAHIPIVARTKEALQHSNQTQSMDVETDECHPHLIAKVENTDDLEFLPEHAEISTTLAQSPMPTIKMDITDEEEGNNLEQHTDVTKQVQQSTLISSATPIDSDEDCKLDIVATLATTNDNNAANGSTNNTPSLASAATQSNAWTRDEDKTILIEMKLSLSNRDDLIQRISSKLPNRTLTEITMRHQFLMDFLSKLQGK